MAVASYLRVILLLLLVTSCTIGQVEGNNNRRRRQAGDGIIRNSDIQQNNPNNVVSNDRNNQQQSNANLLGSSQGQAAPARSRGFYDSPDFQPPSFSGAKPVGWFDTKHVNWISNRNSNTDGAAPSSIQGKASQPRREDGGEFFLQKLAKHYIGKGEKTYNLEEYRGNKERGTVCINQQSYDGYTFNKFRCPLPAHTGMNQLDQYCCGPVNSQYCCNAQEFNQNQGGGLDDNTYGDGHRHPKHPHYPPRSNRALAIILPIIVILVLAGAGVIVFLYYKKIRNEQTKNGKSSSGPTKFSVLPQDPPIEKPVVAPRQQQTTNEQT